MVNICMQENFCFFEFIFKDVAWKNCKKIVPEVIEEAEVILDYLYGVARDR